jgi:hypothetical protein
MDKKQKENIKRIVGEGLSLVLSKLKISRPSAKLERALKKHSRKLADHFKAEVKQLGKKGIKVVTKSKGGKSSKAKGAGSPKQKAAGK